MAKKVKQFRYYKDYEALDLSKNEPSDLTAKKLTTGSSFSNYTPILQLGIQTLPGVKVYLNNAEIPVIVGVTGIYELDLEDKAEITSMRFDESSLTMIAGNTSAYLMVDILYDDLGEVQQ